MHHNTNHAGSGPTAPWGLRGSPPQNYDGRPGELAPASEQGRPEVVGRLGLEPRTYGFMIRFYDHLPSPVDTACYLPDLQSRMRNADRPT